MIMRFVCQQCVQFAAYFLLFFQSFGEILRDALGLQLPRLPVGQFALIDSNLGEKNVVLVGELVVHGRRHALDRWRR